MSQQQPGTSIFDAAKAIVEALKGLDRYAFVEIHPIAVLFTGMVTDPSRRPRKRVCLKEQFVRFTVFPLPGQENKPFNIVANWTC